MKRKQLIEKAERMVRSCQNLDHLKMAEKYCKRVRVALALTRSSSIAGIRYQWELDAVFQDLLDIRAKMLVGSNTTLEWV